MKKSGALTAVGIMLLGGVLPLSEEIIPDENTVLLFHLNNDSNYGENDTHIFDFSNNGNNGTAVGAMPTPYGNISGGFIFDGIDDYVDVGDSNSLDMGVSDFSISLWFKSDSITANTVLVSKRPQGNAGAVNGYITYVLDSDVPYMQIDKSGSYITITGTKDVADGSWHHLAFVADRDDKGYIYVDGVLDNSASIIAVSGDLGNAQSLRVRKGCGAASCEFYGSACTLDEVAVWNRTLTSEEVSAHANATFKIGEIKFQARSCDDDGCVDDGGFVGPGGSTSQYYTDLDYNDISGDVADNQFFQYKAFFSTNTAGTSPELYNVTVEGHTVVEAPELNIDSAWVDWNGQNKIYVFDANRVKVQ